MGVERKVLDLSESPLSEEGKPVGILAIGLAAHFNRFNSRDETTIQKLQVFIDALTNDYKVDLDEADFILFRKLVIASDAWQIIKYAVLKKMDALV